jgi:hypothetical protein
MASGFDIKPKRHIMTFDLGTTTGYAGKKPFGEVYFWSINFKPSKHESHGMRYTKFRRFLESMPDPVDHVYYEAVRNHAGTDAAHMYGGYLAVLQMWCEQNGISYEGIPVATIKKTFTGEGNASKDLMIWTAQAHGFPVRDDNQADALGLLYYGLEASHTLD